MVNESSSRDNHCSCRNNGLRSAFYSYCLSAFGLSLFMGIISLPYGTCVPHIASVLESHDGVPGISMKPIHRGPTVAPVPSPDTLKQLELNGEKNDETYFNPAEAIRSLLSFSSSPTRIQGLKRVSQFRGIGDSIRTNYRGNMPKTREYIDDDDDVIDQIDENGQPTFVPFIGARALTNIPQFFEHLKENIEALKLPPPSGEDDEDGNSETSDDDTGEAGDNIDMHSTLEERPPKKDMKPAARRMRNEFHVDENLERSSDINKPSDSWSTKQSWKPHAAGVIHYYVPKGNLESQHILRRANNYNPAWLYTNLGLGKKRRR